MSATALSGFVTMPHSRAMAWAVRAKSPVTMKMRTPARRSVRTTSGISGRGGSTMATSPTSVRPEAACSVISRSKPEDATEFLSELREMGLCASRSTRRPCADQSFLILSIFSSMAGVRAMEAPDLPT